MRQTLAIARKELETYFGSPMALIFVGVFLVVTLFVFFFVDNFFARGIADVRPLFEWMPLLLIFLIAALTMRQWSEEAQSGHLEALLTLPARLTYLVLGKFLAVLALVTVALLLTLSLPITAGVLGDLDIGPVIGGYVAALLMASAYIAIGLFMSSRTDNQIVALILTVVVGGAFFLIGSNVVTGFFNANITEALRAIGTGSRFESIERGVIDLRDLLYYLTLTGVFLTLNVLSLESQRWGQGDRTRDYRLNRRLSAGLLVVNLIVLNFLVQPVNTVRADLTETGRYTLSDVTKQLISDLDEPLLVRGYFTEETHPQVAPLIPQVRDMLREYEVAGDDNMRVEFVNPLENPEMEAEANQTYGIRPTPLQVSGRSGTSVINAYFDILIRYGDQTVTLNLVEDLIEVDQAGGSADVRLRNLEYDLTSSIQRVIYGFQNVDAVLASFDQPAQLTLYTTPGTLPQQYANAPDTIQTVANDLVERADGKLEFNTVNVSSPESDVTPQQLKDEYGIDPISSGFLSAETYFMHMVLEAGGEQRVIYPPNEISEAEIRNAIESALKRTSSGFLQVVGVWTPPQQPQGRQNPFARRQQQSLQQFSTVRQRLSENFEVQDVDLSDGSVSDSVDALLVIGPQSMNDVQRYAVDQYLMRGGSVFVAAGNYKISQGQTGGLSLQQVQGGLNDMLASYGVNVGDELVLDRQNAPFPVRTTRNVGGASVQEIQTIDYPHFVDVRADGMADSPLTTNLPAVTLNWVSPVSVEEPSEDANYEVTPLLRSTQNAWTTTETRVQPDRQQYPELGFPVGDNQQQYTLAVAVQGRFQSYFQDKESPFDDQNGGGNGPGSGGAVPGSNPLSPGSAQAGGQQDNQEAQERAASTFVRQSPSSARLVVVGSLEFLNDNIFQVMQQVGGERALNNISFVQNTVNWFVEDTALASIRSGGTAARLLQPLSDGEQSAWEVFNYAFALIGLGVLGAIWRMRKRTEQPMNLMPVDEIDSTYRPLQQAREGGD